MLYADHFKLHAASRSVHSLPSLLVAADALRNPELVTVFCKGNVKNCDWLELKQHYSTTGAAAKEMPFGCRAKDSECYVQRYPDLLQGFCGGSVQGCDWFRVVEHWSRVGLTEARVFSCAPHPNPDHNPNPNPNPSPSPNPSPNPTTRRRCTSTRFRSIAVAAAAAASVAAPEPAASNGDEVYGFRRVTN